MNRKRSPDSRQGTGLGTFGGVFTPSVLTILGIIFFRRLGFVVGSAGLTRALLMLALASAISVLTSISLSAIATNRKVHGGGDYYIISRTLGVEFGGALGLILFVAQAISVAFYCVGFGEGVASLIGGSDLVVRVSAVVAAVGLFQLAYAGADLATRFQFAIMAVLAGAILSFFAGSQGTFDVARVLPRASACRATWRIRHGAYRPGPFSLSGCPPSYISPPWSRWRARCRSTNSRVTTTA